MNKKIKNKNVHPVFREILKSIDTPIKNRRRKLTLKEIESNKANKFWRDNFQPSELEEHILLARGKRIF